MEEGDDVMDKWTMIHFVTFMVNLQYRIKEGILVNSRKWHTFCTGLSR